MVIEYNPISPIEKPYINAEGDIALPNENSFYVFGSKSILTRQIETILQEIIQENENMKRNAVFIKYCA